ncbi:MAG: hypothetical protein AAFY41_04735 [Bacteroidota bacterium]
MISLSAQTRIAVPTTTVQFDDLTMLEKKKNKNEFKKYQRTKKRNIKKLRNSIRKNTELEKDELQRYTSVFQGLDTASINKLQNEIDHLKQSDYPNLTKRETKALARVESANATDISMDGLTHKGLYKPDSSILHNYYDGYSAKDRKKSFWPMSRLDSSQINYQNYIVDSIYNHEKVDKENIVSSLQKTNEVDSSFIQTDSSLILSNTTVSNRIEKHLDAYVKKQVDLNNASFGGLDNPYASTEQQVKQYIPDLEKFDYQKPTIPKEKLDEAIVQQYKERKVDELKKELALKDAEKFESEHKGLSKFAIGGYARYDAAKESIELTPTLAYRLNKRISLGIGYQTNVSFNGSDSLNTRGIRAFSEYVFLDTYFVHVESEWLKRNVQGESSSAIKERNSYIGLGKNFKYKFFTTSVLALYNFNAPSQLVNRKFSIRIGLSISK